MMGHYICFKGVVWKLIPKLFVLPLLIWSTDKPLLVWLIADIIAKNYDDDSPCFLMFDSLFIIFNGKAANSNARRCVTTVTVKNDNDVICALQMNGW